MATTPILMAVAVRRSITLPSEIAEKIDRIAEARHVSSARVLVNLIQDGIAAYEKRREEFFALAERFHKSTDPDETGKLREELGRMTFGE